jgi:hypothetical protein
MIEVMALVLSHPEASLRIEDLGGSRLLAVEPTDAVFIPFKTWETSYPVDRIEKIFEAKGALVLDEIMRDESPAYFQYEVYWEMLRGGARRLP